MRIAMSTYSMFRRFDDGSLNQLTSISKAKELGFDAMEIVEIEPHDGSTKLDYAKKLRDECERLGMPVICYCTGADFLRCENINKEIERVQKEVDIAAILGAPRMRHDATLGYPEGKRGNYGFDDCLPVLAMACKQITEYAKTLGIRTMVENHGHFCIDSTRVEKLANAVKDPNFGLLLDMGNFMDGDEELISAYSRVAPYTIHVHAKDFHFKSGEETDPGEGWYITRGGNRIRGAVVGHGCVPVKQCLSILFRNGYDGDITIEFEGIEDPEYACILGLSNLKRYIAEARQ